MWKQRECTEMCHEHMIKSAVYQIHACLRLLYVTAIVFTLIAILNHQKKLVCFIQPRKRAYHTVVGCFDVTFSLYFTMRDALQKRSQSLIHATWVSILSTISYVVSLVFFTLTLFWTNCLNGLACWITGLKTFPEFSGLKWSHCKQRSKIGKNKGLE